MAGLSDEQLLKRMIDVLHHRGPDDSGFFVDEQVALGNARLSIIDIEGGHQPIQNEDGTVTVTYNGEIYNYQKLRRELEGLGHRFRTKSDTEVIVHSYEQYSEAFVEKLNGMFAIALWDTQQRKLVLARDRMGIKPLYYTVRDGAIVFASEMKSILQSPSKRKVNLESLYAILNLGYISGDGTLIEGIRKLLPSSLLVYKEGSVRTESYWQIPDLKPFVNEDEVVGRLKLALEESIRDQLVADVPVGCFLSGGLDTSSIVAFASRASGQPLKTFCMGFGEETDEFQDARVIAERFGTDHRELTVDSSLGMKLYPRMLWHMEAPKYNLYPWFVCELVHKYVKVCLSGNGGDEVFGGYYARYENALRIEKLTRRPFASLIKVSSQLIPTGAQDIKSRNRLRVLQSLGNNAEEYLILAGCLPEKLNEALFKGRLSEKQLTAQYSPFFDGKDLLQGLMDAELRTKLVDDLLSVDDTMSMAHSVELRVPLLDNRIVDLMASIPWQSKYSPGTHGKQLLRKAIRDVLPEQSLRKPKWGFSVNVQAWFKGEVGEIVRQVLPDSEVIQAYFRADEVRKLLAETSNAERDRRRQVLLWQLLGFHFWHRIFIDSGRVDAPSLSVEALVA